MIKPEFIGALVYSKVLKRNVLIQQGPGPDYWKKIGLGFILSEEQKKEKQKFPKHDPDNEVNNE